MKILTQQQKKKKHNYLDILEVYVSLLFNLSYHSSII